MPNYKEMYETLFAPLYRQSERLPKLNKNARCFLLRFPIHRKRLCPKVNQPKKHKEKRHGALAPCRLCCLKKDI